VYDEVCEFMKVVVTNNVFIKALKKRLKSVPVKKSLYYFQDLAIRPAQHLPRYILLLQSLRKLTPTSHPMFNDLLEGMAVIRDTCGHINDHTKKMENTLMLYKLNTHIDKKGLESFGYHDLMEASRRLVRHGTIIIQGKGRQISGYFGRQSSRAKMMFEDAEGILCNDILIIQVGHKRKSVKHVLPVKYLKVEIDEMVLPYKGKNLHELTATFALDSVSMFFDSLQEANAWKESICKYNHEVKKIS